MALTRDSMLWWLGIIGAVLTYLAASPPPTAWSYAEWVQALAFVVATVSAKLASSPLPGAPKATEPDHDDVAG